MQILPLAVAAALVGAASAKDPSDRIARKRSTIKYQSKVKADETYDPFLGLADAARKLEQPHRDLQMSVGSMPPPSPAPTDLVGKSYCTWGPNYTCFVTGWPNCCSDDNEECPEERPECEITLPPTPRPTPAPISPASASSSGSSILGAATALCAVAGSAVLASL